jgi:hypothetical protein
VTRRVLLASAVMGLVISGAACHAARHPAAVVTPNPSLGCDGSGVRVVSTGAVAVRHTRAQVLARLRLGAGASVRGVTAAGVLDPLAAKIGLPSGPRVMWLVTTREPVVATRGPAVLPSAGAQSLLRLVDDATLTSAGAFTCPS